MGALRICLFGDVSLEHEGSSGPARMCRTVDTLLAYLLIHRHRYHPRSALAGILWPDHDDGHARRCLNTALWRLRSVLEPPGVPHGTYLLTERIGHVAFNCASNFWLDVAVFEDRVSQVLRRAPVDMDGQDVTTLAGALQTYSGELLEGFYDDWVLAERERLRLLRLHCLERLMRYHHRQGAFVESLICASEILACEPLREDVHQEMMQLYRDTGQRALALRQFEICRRLLNGELGIEPMEETRQLYAALKKDGARGHVPARAARECADLNVALEQLRAAIADSDRARRRLTCAVARLERMSGTPPC